MKKHKVVEHVTRKENSKSNSPSHETEQVMKETEKRENLEEHSSLHDFWSSMGF